MNAPANTISVRVRTRRQCTASTPADAGSRGDPNIAAVPPESISACQGKSIRRDTSDPVGQRTSTKDGGNPVQNPSDVRDQFIRNSAMSDLEARAHQLSVDVRSRTRKDLIARYPAEWNCYRGMRGRERTNGAVVSGDLRSFAGFLKSLGPCPAPGYTVDRTDCLDPEYSPRKVRWASKKVQANNRISTVLLAGRDGKLKPVTQQAALTGQKPDTIRKRLKRGWSEEEALAGSRSVIGTAQTAIGRTTTENCYAIDGLTQLGWPIRFKGKEREWERAWKKWCASQPYERSLSRLGFFIWIIGNQNRVVQNTLEDRFPDAVGCNANPQGELGPEVTGDSLWQRNLWVGQVLDHWKRRLNRSEQDHVSRLIKSYPHIYRNLEQIDGLIKEIKDRAREAKCW